jgi:glucuronate isomerase
MRMKKFMGKDFLLSSKTARKLFFEAAREEPIFDYHCHLIPQEIAENQRFPTIAAMWLGGDHYKWRVLRANGIPENLITGNADPYDKFLAWADTVPKLIGNPLYHWTHLELQRYFGINEPLNRRSADYIWDAANQQLANDPDFSVFGIFKKFKVRGVGTTDDPADTLEWHHKTKGACETLVIPSFRPDRIVNIEKPDFPAYIEKLAAVAGKSIGNLDDLLAVIVDRIDFFSQMGCRASDHGLDYMPYATAHSDNPREKAVNHGQWESEVKQIFAAALDGKAPDSREAESWKTFILYFLGGQYFKHGWVMQIHLAAIRNNNTQALGTIGPDTGFDAVHDHPLAEKLSRFLDLLDYSGALPRTILYSLNSKDFYTMGTLMGCFQGTSDFSKSAFPGKMQLGSGWWFLDHIDGMETQMKILGNIGLLSRFIGMLTDSRSFLSYPRHEYFRRVLCNIVGAWAENGEIPCDMPLLKNMVRDISFRNAWSYFNMPLNKGGNP